MYILCNNQYPQTLKPLRDQRKVGNDSKQSFNKSTSAIHGRIQYDQSSNTAYQTSTGTCELTKEHTLQAHEIYQPREKR